MASRRASLQDDARLLLASESERDAKQPTKAARVPDGSRRETMRAGMAVFGQPSMLSWASFAGTRMWGLCTWSRDGSPNPVPLHAEDEELDYAGISSASGGGPIAAPGIVTRQPRPLPIDSRAQWPDMPSLASQFARIPFEHAATGGRTSCRLGRVPPSGLLELIAFAESQPRHFTMPLHILTSKRSAEDLAVEDGAAHEARASAASAGGDEEMGGRLILRSDSPVKDRTGGPLAMRPGLDAGHSSILSLAPPSEQEGGFDPSLLDGGPSAASVPSHTTERTMGEGSVTLPGGSTTAAVLPTAAAQARVLLGLGDRPPARASTGRPPSRPALAGSLERWSRRREPLGEAMRGAGAIDRRIKDDGASSMAEGKAGELEAGAEIQAAEGSPRSMHDTPEHGLTLPPGMSSVMVRGHVSADAWQPTGTVHVFGSPGPGRVRLSLLLSQHPPAALLVPSDGPGAPGMRAGSTLSGTAAGVVLGAAGRGPLGWRPQGECYGWVGRRVWVRRRLSTGLLELWPYSTYAAASISQAGALTGGGGITAGEGWNADPSQSQSQSQPHPPAGRVLPADDPSWSSEDSGCALAGSALGLAGPVPGTVAVDVWFARDGSGRCLITTHQEGAAGAYEAAGLAGRRLAAGGEGPRGAGLAGGTAGDWAGRVPSLAGAGALPHEWVPGFRFYAFAARVAGTSPLALFSRKVSRSALADAETEAAMAEEQDGTVWGGEEEEEEEDGVEEEEGGGTERDAGHGGRDGGFSARVRSVRAELRRRWRRAQRAPRGKASISRAGARAAVAVAGRAAGGDPAAAAAELAEAGHLAAEGTDEAVHCELRDPKDGPPVGKWRHITTLFMFP